MKILVTGGSANGKSTWAEELAVSLPEPRWYLAAMLPYGPESLECIARHRARHSRQGFTTIERYTDLAGLRLPGRGTVLLECLCNLLGNEMFDEERRIRDAVPDILRGLDALAEQCDDLIIVTNDVGSGDFYCDPSSRAYVEALGRLNIAAAARCDQMVEVAAGIAVARKGALPAVRAKEKGDRPMTLVIGGAASGKRSYVRSLGFQDEDMADAVLDSRPVVCHVEKLAARSPEEADELLPALLEKQVVICAEVGSGIIPATPEERAARIAVGRLCARLAERADRVVRMVCGIPITLKGGEGDEKDL